MPDTVMRGVLISDFTADNLAALIARSSDAPEVRLEPGRYGPVIPTLVGPATWEGDPDFAVVWTRPEGAVPSFADVARFRHVSDEIMILEVDAFADAVLAAAKRFPHVLVCTWVLRPSQRGLGPMDRTHRRGLRRTLDMMNARLADRLRDAGGIHLLDARRWFEQIGASGHDPRSWYLAKIPYSAPVFELAATDVKAALRAVTGRARKLIIVDLDDTLWGGTLGEVGWRGLRLGGHDAVGEAHVDFQQGLKALARRGIVLAIASKNDEETALTAIQEHPEMVLRLEDFAGWRINWEDKARNIVDLVASLNLGLDAAVFIDDNPAERGRIREALPEVMVPDWPATALHYLYALESLPWFDPAQLSAEDEERAQLYSAERERKELKDSMGSIDEWLATLDIRIRVDPLGAENAARVVQLLNKTNQMNLSTRRLSEAELFEWARTRDNAFWAFRMTDRFSDSGITGLLGVTREGQRLRIVDWVLSCRVMGRRMEETMLHIAAEHGRSVGAKEVVATYRPTERNRPCLDFWRDRSGFAAAGDDATFAWSLQQPYPAPQGVSLELEVPAA
jgi:FkbH-like protein